MQIRGILEEIADSVNTDAAKGFNVVSISRCDLPCLGTKIEVPGNLIFRGIRNVSPEGEFQLHSSKQVNVVKDLQREVVHADVPTIFEVALFFGDRRRVLENMCAAASHSRVMVGCAIAQVELLSIDTNGIDIVKGNETFLEESDIRA